MKLPKIKIKKIKNFLQKLPRKLALRAFSTFFGLLVFSLILGAIIFYKYVILIKQKEIELSEEVLRFEEKTYQEVLSNLEEKEKRFKDTDSKEYLDIFKEIKEKSQETNSQSSPKEEPEEPEEPEGSELQKERLKAAANLYIFYFIKGEFLPSIDERAKIWEEKGFGLAQNYKGFSRQNIKLLEALKEELTE